MKTNNTATGIIGKRVGGEPANEAEHFYTCSHCGQAVDKRDLGQVFHHMQHIHDKLELDS